MKVTQEKLPASQIGLEIEITPEMSKSAYEKVIKDFTRSMNIPGFRKGKVPRQVLIQQFGVARIKASAIEELIDSSLKKALEQEKIEALGNFQLRSSFEDLISQFEPGAPLTFSAAVDVQPEVTLKSYQGFTLKAEEIQPDPDRTATVIEGYRKQLATLVPVEGRPAQMGDTTVVDYKGTFIPADDAEPQDIPGGQAEDFQVDMEEGRFIPGFLEGIVGMNPDDTREIEVDFPADYANATLAGRPAKFVITLKELKERELPELDDDFAKEVSNEQFQTLAELQESLNQRFQNEADQKTKQNKEEALLAELLQQIEVDLPETLVDRELNYLVSQTAMQLEQQGIDVRKFLTPDTLPMLKDRSRPEAIDRLKRTLALGEIAKSENITVEPAAVNERLRDLLSEIDDSSKVDLERARDIVAEELLKEKILDWLESHSTIELVPEGSLAPAPSDAAEAATEATVEAVPATIDPATVTVEVAAETVAETVAESAPGAALEAAASKPAAEPAAASPDKAESASEPETAIPTEPEPEAVKPEKAKKARAKKTT
jgi:trigger factor